MYSHTAARASSAPAGPLPTAHSRQTAAARAGGSVRAMCRSSLARSACQGLTGRDRISQRVPPSSETEGGVSRFMDASEQTDTHASAGPRAAGPGSRASAPRSSPAFHTAATAAAASSKLPSSPLTI